MYMVGDGISGKCIIATTHIHTGTVLFTFNPACTQKEKTYQSIQVGPDQHCHVGSDLAFLNHSCNPNLIVDTKNGIVYAQKNILPGEELNFFYPSTEWDMARPFLCNCGNPGCIQYVRGAYWTPLHVLSGRFLNEHIIDLIMAEINQAKYLHAFVRADKCYSVEINEV